MIITIIIVTLIIIFDSDVNILLIIQAIVAEIEELS